ncbi:MAG: hypothetical protein ACFFD3_01990 [Candidatus Thorarchaeota archaeon]
MPNLSQVVYTEEWTSIGNGTEVPHPWMPSALSARKKSVMRKFRAFTAQKGPMR